MSLVEVLIAVLVLATLGVAIQSTMVGTLQGIQIDRATEVKRHVCLDLLERFATPYSDVESLFARGDVAKIDGKVAVSRSVTVDEALAMIAVSGPEAAAIKQTLQTAGVTAFTLAWNKGLQAEGSDAPAALRMDKLWCFPVTARTQPGGSGAGFRLFCLRGK